MQHGNRFFRKSLSATLFVLFLILYPIEGKSQISDDATILTLRHQQGILLDSSMAFRIDSRLSIARTALDTLIRVHAWTPYVPKQLLISFDSTVSWVEPWKHGGLLTGDPFIDSLAITYKLDSVDYRDLSWPSSTFKLLFSEPMEMNRLGQAFEQHSDVRYAQPNYIIGDGNDISYREKDSAQLFVFINKWGDCPAGCISSESWYVSVTNSDSGRKATLEEYLPSGTNDGTGFYRWNMPWVFPMAQFPNVDSILRTIIQAQEWWKRRHAIEGSIWLLNSYVPTSRDSGLIPLQNALIERRNDLLTALQLAAQDNDADVRASATSAIRLLPITGINDERGIPSSVLLRQNYPNPFNPVTMIAFELPTQDYVSLRVYNVLGEEIEILAQGWHKPGTHSFAFYASDFPSGVYFYVLRGQRFSISRKMLLIR